MNRGYTKRWRKRWDKGYHKDLLLFALMEYFIDHANYKDTDVYIKGVGLIPLRRGERIFGTLSLAVFMGVDRQQIRSKLKMLKNINFLTIRSTNKYSIASIINYDTYNPVENKLTSRITNRITSNQPATNQQLTTDKELKKGKKEKKEKPEWLDLDLWKEFKKMRVRLKAPLTEYAETRAFLKLKKLMDEGYKQADILNQSIECSWKGLFPVKYKKDDIAYRKDPFQDDLFLRQAYDLIGKDKEFNNHCNAFNRDPEDVRAKIKEVRG